MTSFDFFDNSNGAIRRSATTNFAVPSNAPGEIRFQGQVVQCRILEQQMAATGQTKSFGDVGSMSGLPESGHGWASYEYTILISAASKLGLDAFSDLRGPPARKFALRQAGESRACSTGAPCGRCSEMKGLSGSGAWLAAMLQYTRPKPRYAVER
jgi:hypothetical protein